MQFSLTLGLDCQVGDPEDRVRMEIEDTILKAQDQIPSEIFKPHIFDCVIDVTVDWFGYYMVTLYIDVSYKDE